MAYVTPYVPEYITVHLGTPNSNARNVVVSFPDYIKNVASSEIYPTWNEEAIIANIYAQISFALNRVYLEHYPVRGYNFQITNSTAYDQKFIVGRNIFTNISKTVDDIFNNYIRRISFIEPLGAKYCNGTTTTCEGLSQWGSESLANQGYSSTEILKYYYGYNIELVTNAPVTGIKTSYPGYPVRLGARGDYVLIIQTNLNRIGQTFYNIPKTYPVDGIFGPVTESAVRAFQKTFHLTVDGIVGQATWNKMSLLYTSLLNLAELESEGQRYAGESLEYPGDIAYGETSDRVEILQYFLAVIGQFYSDIPTTQITGTFDAQTKDAVIAVQKASDLPQTGVVNDITWNVIYREYKGIVDTMAQENYTTPCKTMPYCGTVLQIGSRGECVEALQCYLNTIAEVFQVIPSVNVTGVYDQKTANAVAEYQKKLYPPATGKVDEATWNAICNSYRDAISSISPAPVQYPGYELKYGEVDRDISLCC